MKCTRIPYQENGRKIFSEFLKIFICLWMVFISLLLRSYNIVLVSSLFLVSNFLAEILKKKSNRTIKLVIAHHWLAYVYFFCQVTYFFFNFQNLIVLFFFEFSKFGGISFSDFLNLTLVFFFFFFEFCVPSNLESFFFFFFW